MTHPVFPRLRLTRDIRMRRLGGDTAADGLADGYGGRWGHEIMPPYSSGHTKPAFEQMQVLKEALEQIESQGITQIRPGHSFHFSRLEEARHSMQGMRLETHEKHVGEGSVWWEVKQASRERNCRTFFAEIALPRRGMQTTCRFPFLRLE